MFCVYEVDGEDECELSDGDSVVVVPNNEIQNDFHPVFPRTFLWRGHSGFLTRIPAEQFLLR